MHLAQYFITMTYKFYPQNLWDYDPRYKTSEEHINMLKTIKANKKKLKWNPFLNALKEEFSNKEYFIEDRSIISKKDPCFKGSLEKKVNGYRLTLVYFISLLDNYYTIYYENPFPDTTSGKTDYPSDIPFITFNIPPELTAESLKLKGMIKKTFKEYVEFPKNLLGMQVDNICYEDKGHPFDNCGLLATLKMTLFNAFFSNLI
ncbi:MAG: hypothetical protein QM668_22055 [Agriterribacter sp.]